MIMTALSARLDGMVLASWMVENISIVQNIQSVVEKLKYCAEEQAYGMSQTLGSNLKVCW